MNELKRRIYLKKWAELKPYRKQARTDLYYLKLSNDVKRALLENKSSAGLLIYLEAEEIDTLACFLTSYFEDLISRTNIWNSFVRMHKRLYGKALPFYDLSAYYEDEINLQDVCFLIWYFVNALEEDKFISPLNSFIIEMATKVMEVFDEAWEFAPENDQLKLCYDISEDEIEFYTARELIDKVLFQTYLFYPDTFLKLFDSEVEIVENREHQENVLAYLNENRDHGIHHYHTKLLGLKGKEWVAEILGANHRLSEEFLKISQKITGLFFYKGQDEKNIFMEHIASGKKFNLSKKSFDNHQQLKETDTIMFMGIVKWRDEWWFSGVYFEREFDADLVLEERNSIESRRVVNFLDKDQDATKEVLAKQQKAFLEFNSDAQIAFMTTDDVQVFVAGFMAQYNKSLNLSEKDQKEAADRARAEGYFGHEEKKEPLPPVLESAAVFFNPKSGVEIALGVNSAFPSAENPFYVEEDNEQDLINLILFDSISPELVHYCIDNFKDKMPFLQDAVGMLYLDNLDFLLRFFKGRNYFSKPEITFTGAPK
jgi:hypothetical protein